MVIWESWKGEGILSSWKRTSEGGSIVIDSGTEDDGPAASACFYIWSSLLFIKTIHYYEVWDYHNSKLWHLFWASAKTIVLQANNNPHFGGFSFKLLTASHFHVA